MGDFGKIIGNLFGKKATKIIKRALKKVVVIFLPIILIILIALTVTSGLVYLMTIQEGSYSEGDKKNVPFNANQYLDNITIDDNGNITTSMTPQQVWEQMQKNNARIEDYLTNSKELFTLMNAEIVTKFLDTRKNPDDPIDWDNLTNINSNKVQGIIKLKRAQNDGTTITMTYVSPDTLKSYMEEYERTGSEDARKRALSHFTIKDVAPEGSTLPEYNAVVATWKEVHDELTSSDPAVVEYSSDTYTMEEEYIDYEEATKGYTMPFDYLWAFVVAGRDKEFPLELAGLVRGSEIEITVQDNLVTTTNINTYTYTNKTKIVTDHVAVAVYYRDFGNPETGEEGRSGMNLEIGGPFEGEKFEDYETVHTVITKENTLAVNLTKADVWIANYTQNYTMEVPTTTQTSSDTPLEDIDYGSEPDSSNNVDELGMAENYRRRVEANYDRRHDNASASLDSLRSYYYSGKTNQNINILNIVETTKYVTSPAVIIEKTDPLSDEPNFVNLFLKREYYEFKNNIISAPDWLFKILKNSEKTVDMVDLTKYLLYKATGRSYGVTKLDDRIFDIGELISISGGVLGDIEGVGSVQRQIIDFLLSKGVPKVGIAAIMGNIEAESSFDPGNVNEIGCSGLIQWKGSRFEDLQEMAAKNSVEWTDVNIQMEFMWRELETVSTYSKVKSVIMSITDESKLEYVTWYWARYYEVAFSWSNNFEESKGDSARRYKYAQNWYQKITQPGAITGDGSTADYSSVEDINKYNLNVHNNYIEYKQGDYDTIPPRYSATGKYGTIREKGCLPTCISIILSGMGVTDSNGQIYTPESLIVSGTIDDIPSGSSNESNARKTFNKVGLTGGAKTSTSGQANNILSNLEAGNAILVHASTGYYTSGGHYMALIDVNGNNVYLSNPGSRSKSGWVNINTLISRNVDWYMVVSR